MMILAVEVIRNNMVGRHSELRLYLDILPDPSMVGCSVRSSEMFHRSHSHTKRILLEDVETTMVFLKHFNATKQSLSGIGRIHVPRARKVGDLIPIINGVMKWAPGTQLKLYEVTDGGFLPI